MSSVSVTYCATKHTETFPYPVSVEQVLEKAPSHVVADKKDVVAMRVDGLIMDLNSTVPGHRACVDVVLARSKDGRALLKRSIVYVMMMAAAKVHKDWFLTVEHDAVAGAQYNGVVCSVDEGAHKVTKEEVDKLKAEMQRIISADLPLKVESLSRQEASDYFRDHKCKYTSLLIEQCNSFCIDCIACDGHYEVKRQGAYAKSTGVRGMENFDLVLNEDEGFVLAFQKDNKDMHPSETMAKTFVEWNRIGRDVLSASCVGESNERLLKDGPYFKAFCEEIHSQRLVTAVAKVRERYDAGARLVLIAGPSSSGKTTFAHKLAMQLRVAGMQPLILSVDNYYKAHDDCPRDEDGKIDFEVVEALRVDVLNKDLVALFNGETIHSPVFDFKAGRPSETQTIAAKLPPHGVVIMEGIHCLNDRLTPLIPKENKVKIFIAPLSNLNIDESFVVANDYVRLIRRIVRDNRSRGYSALDTLSRWESVRRGEDLHIFPFMKDADVVYNTSLSYEVNVLKTFCMPLLTSVKPGSEYYQLARELEEFMSFFIATPYDDIPAMSLLREFIGGSFYKTG